MNWMYIASTMATCRSGIGCSAPIAMPTRSCRLADSRATTNASSRRCWFSGMCITTSVCLQQPGLATDEHTFQRKHLLLGLDAARRREATELAACREYAVARDDQRHGVARHRDADVLRSLRLVRANTFRKLAVGDSLAKADLA